MSNYVQVSRCWLQDGDFVGADGVPRRIVRVEMEVDANQADRLAGHYAGRTAQGRTVFADEARELATPIMAALDAAGFGVDEDGNGMTLGTALDVNIGVP